MKCSECGFQNSQNVTLCSHCGTVLNFAESESRTKEDKRTQLGQGTSERDLVSQTIVDKSYFEHGIIDKALKECEKCKYIMRTGAIVCPNCDESVIPKAIDSEPNTHSALSQKRTKKMEDFLVDSPTPLLHMLPLHNSHLPAFENIDKELNISRDDVDKGDMSLSSTNHIQITYDQESETWYLENTASNQAVFIQVNGKIPITPDMVVLLGQSKLYRLVIKQNKKSK